MINGLSTRLKELREKYGYSQKEVANNLNISPSIVSGYETGERTPSAEKLLSLSRLYHCSTDYLLGRTSEEPPVLLEVDELEPHQIDALIRFIHAMKEKS